LVHSTQPRHQAQPAHATDNAVIAQPATAALSTVPALPAVATEANVIALPADATLHVVAALPTVATLVLVPAATAVTRLSLVATDAIVIRLERVSRLKMGSRSFNVSCGRFMARIIADPACHYHPWASTTGSSHDRHCPRPTSRRFETRAVVCTGELGPHAAVYRGMAVTMSGIDWVSG
jgi:hypothetical protein